MRPRSNAIPGCRTRVGGGGRLSAMATVAGGPIITLPSTGPPASVCAPFRTRCLRAAQQQHPLTEAGPCRAEHAA